MASRSAGSRARSSTLPRAGCRATAQLASPCEGTLPPPRYACDSTGSADLIAGQAANWGANRWARCCRLATEVDSSDNNGSERSAVSRSWCNRNVSSNAASVSFPTRRARDRGCCEIF